MHLAQHEDVWVLTRRSNRQDIELALSGRPVAGLHFVYYDLPKWISWWKRGLRGVRLYYYLWQFGAYLAARRAHRSVDFELVRHVTWIKYAVPSFCSLLPVPFVWGPVGGGVRPPPPFRKSYSARGKLFDSLRIFVRRLGELDPFVRMTARRSVCALANTEATAVRLRRLGARQTALTSDSGLTAHQFEELEPTRAARSGSFRVVSVGRLVHWKGFHLGVEAFAAADLESAEYWIIGDGPERGRLEAHAERLGLGQKVQFLGRLSRLEVLRRLKDCDLLLHPSLHDSGGVTCLEGMAAGKPVVCLDIGGPSEQVTNSTGILVPAKDPTQVICDLAAALRKLEADPVERAGLGAAGRQLVASHFLWEVKVAQEHRRHELLLAGDAGCC